MNKTTNFPKALSLYTLIIIAVRILSLLIFSLFAYLSSDPGSIVPIYSIICRGLCDLICGYIIAKAIGRDFSLSTRIFFAMVTVIVLSVLEMFAGKLIFPAQETAFYMIPISAVASFIGGIVSGKKKAYKKHKRRHRRK